MRYRFAILAHILSFILLAAVTLGLSGCDQSQNVPVQTVVVDRSEFCEIMKDLHPPSGKISWDVGDTPRTIHQIRRTDAAVDKCQAPRK